MTNRKYGEFVENSDIEFLEASATILYYSNKANLNPIEKNKIIDVLSYLKPY